MPGRLTKLVTFKRLRTDIPPDDAGHIDESADGSWRSLGQRRGECEETSSNESNGDNLQSTGNVWKIVCRGDELTNGVTTQDRVEWYHAGRIVVCQLTGIRTLNHVPLWLELTGVEER